MKLTETEVRALDIAKAFKQRYFLQLLAYQTTKNAKDSRNRNAQDKTTWQGQVSEDLGKTN